MKAIYQIENIDCFTLFRYIKNDSIQLIITSPPYNIGKAYETKQPLIEYLKKQEEIIKECYRILKNSGSICWQVGNYIEDGEVYPLDIYFHDIFKRLGMKLRNRIIWHFGHGLHCKKRLSGRYETILWFTKSDDYTFNLDPIRVPQKYPNKKYFRGKNKGKMSCHPIGKNPSDVWEISNVKHNHPEKTEHPCQFPEELVNRLVLALSNKEDIILDPYLGSGTSAVSAIKYARKFIGSEINKFYYKLALKRIHGILEKRESESTSSNDNQINISKDLY